MNRYRFAACALFITEVLIALYVHDTLIRPYIGDVLVAILVYCAVKSVVNTPVFKTAGWVLLFCYAIETAQYFELLKRLGLQNISLARIILGTYFSWTDMLCYTIGIIIVLAVESFSPKPTIKA